MAGRVRGRGFGVAVYIQMPISLKYSPPPPPPPSPGPWLVHTASGLITNHMQVQVRTVNYRVAFFSIYIILSWLLNGVVYFSKMKSVVASGREKGMTTMPRPSPPPGGNLASVAKHRSILRPKRRRQARPPRQRVHPTCNLLNVTYRRFDSFVCRDSSMKGFGRFCFPFTL